MQNALGRLEGVQSAKVGKKKTEYTVKVFEKKSVTPKMIADAITEASYEYKGLNIEITGTISKDGDGYVFESRGAKTKFALKANDEAKNLAGKIAVVTGKVTYDAKDSKKAPTIEVTGAKEAK